MNEALCNPPTRSDAQRSVFWACNADTSQPHVKTHVFWKEQKLDRRSHCGSGSAVLNFVTLLHEAEGVEIP